MEKTLNLTLALKVKEALQKAGQDVVLSREGDTDVPLEARVNLARQVGAALLLSLHHNSATSPQAGGAETYYQASRPESRRLANLVQTALTKATGLAYRGVKTRLRSDGREYYYILREAPMPAVICEVGFLTNPADAARLGTPAFQEAAAHALAGALLQFVAPAPAGPFPDVPPDHWAAPAVAWAARRGLLRGYPDGRFHGEEAVTRYELAGVLYRLAGQELANGKHQGEAGQKAEG